MANLAFIGKDSFACVFSILLYCILPPSLGAPWRADLALIDYLARGQKQPVRDIRGFWIKYDMCSHRGRDEIEGVYLPSQLEHTLQLCTWWWKEVGVHLPPSPSLARANFSIMMECTPESSRFHSVWLCGCSTVMGMKGLRLETDSCTAAELKGRADIVLLLEDKKLF